MKSHGAAIKAPKFFVKAPYKIVKSPYVFCESDFADFIAADEINERAPSNVKAPYKIIERAPCDEPSSEENFE